MNIKLNMKDISKGTLQMQIFLKNDAKKPTFLRKHVSMKLLEVSLSCLSLMFSEGEVKSPYFLQVW